MKLRSFKVPNLDRKSTQYVTFIVAGGLLVLIILICIRYLFAYRINTLMATSTSIGVNYGGLFVLEDWFYGKPGSDPTKDAIFASTPINLGAVAYTSLLDGSEDIPNLRFSSESNLIKQLKDMGENDAEIIKIFDDHRRSYIPSGDMAHMRPTSKFSIDFIRVPIPWCFNFSSKPFNIHNVKINPMISEIISDPFLDDTYWCTLSTTQLERILQEAMQYNKKIVLAIHTFPGG